ncbi:MAG: hypothetical protein IJ535_12570 [Pseudobutyrivibrio sp.]|uniref:pyruvate kinase n=1 Tax=Pseudobutyrivibrio sp. TaxID=2014367 RepID=UPI0025EBEBB9|nr:pyruvate kinase [Pseudobutyrivibrio sp.]MBQ8490607.1 hypothetical protein [Pseudobutyrivibrio sp.]
MEKIFTVNNKWAVNDYCNMVDSGITSIRVNGIHATDDTIKIISHLKKERQIKIYYDLPGVKWRIWSSNRERIQVHESDEIFLYNENYNLTNPAQFRIIGERFWDNIRKGDIFFIRRVHRENVIIEINEAFAGKARATVLHGGLIGYGYHIYNPYEYKVNNELSELDLKQDQRIRRLEPNIIVVSFADTEEIVKQAKNMWGEKSDIFAKIETKEAINNLDDVLKVADGIVIGRDDLSAFLKKEEIRGAVETILNKCIKNNLRCIGASNYLQNVYENNTYDEEDLFDIEMLIQKKAYGIYINETNKDSCWSKYLRMINKMEDICMDFSMIS